MLQKIMRLDINSLTEFNPAIVYDLYTSNPLSPDSSQEHPSAYVTHLYKQSDDVLIAYLYLQNTVLPVLRTMNICDLEPAQIITWLNEIHKRIAATVIADKQKLEKDTKLGDISPFQSVIFQEEPQVVHGLIRFSEVNSKETTLATFKTNKPEIINFIDLIFKAKQILNSGVSAKLFPPQKKLTLLFLTQLYHDNKFTPEEKKTLSIFAKILPQPSEQKLQLQQFAQTFVERLKKCIQASQEEKINFCCEIYNDILSGHWYADGNGRAATAFCNLWLRYFSLPSIQARTSKEPDNPHSPYNTCLKNIDKDPHAIINDIRRRINEALANPVQRHENGIAIFTNRSRLCAMFKVFSQVFPSFDIDAYYDQAGELVYEKLASKNIDVQSEVYQLVGTGALASSLQVKINELVELKDNQLKKDYERNELSTVNLEYMLRKAASKGNLIDINYLLLKGVDINKADSTPDKKRTALHWAAINGRYEAVKLLLAKGADPTCRDAQNNLPLNFLPATAPQAFRDLLAVDSEKHTCRP